MAKSVRVFKDLFSGTTNATLLIGGTSLSAAVLANLQVIADPNFIALTLDPEAAFGTPEIVHVTAHTSSSTTATIQRGQEGTTAREHASTTKVIAAVTAAALGELTEPVGAIKLWPMAAMPVGGLWLLCDGTQVSRTTYAALNALMAVGSYPFGAGNGSTTFHLPDFRDKSPYGVGPTHVSLAETGGTFDHTHTGPSHTHTGPSHTHTQPAHTHTIAHTHTFSGTTSGHSNDHTHQIDPPDTNTGFSNTGVGLGAAGGFGFTPDHIHAVNIGPFTSGGASANHDHTYSGTTSGSSAGSTGSGGGDNTGADGTGATGASGTGATGTAQPPYLGVNFIIRAA